MTAGVQVLFIAGTGRSGTTVIETVLAHRLGYLAAGEVCYLWERGVRDNQLCGCGRAFRDCPFWNSVLDAAFGGIDNIDLDHIIKLARTVVRVRNIPSMWQGGASTAAATEYAELLARLYAAIAAVGGGRTVLDSSKDSRNGFALVNAPGVQMRVLHVVRDSRAVAHSWQRVRSRPEIHWTDAAMPRYSPRSAVRRWTVGNATAALLRRRACGRLIRYEDAVTDPEVLDRLVDGERAVGAAPTSQPLLHSVSGNPLRFQPGSMERIVLDDAWRHEMSARDFRFVTAATAAQLTAYGYALSRRA